MSDDHNSRRGKHKRGYVLEQIPISYSYQPFGKDMPNAKPCYSEGGIGYHHSHYTVGMKGNDDGYL